MTDLNARNPHLRGLGFYDPSKQQHDKVTFVGVGGIGSFAALGAAKLGVPHITLYDDDEVEAHNYGNQAYTQSDIGVRKIHAIMDRIGDVSNLHGHAEKADANTAFDGVVVSGLDSMAARSDVWGAIKYKPQVPLYMDARIGGQIIVIYTVNPVKMDDITSYEETLHSDDEGVSAPCTERGVADVGLMVGSVITRNLRRWFTEGTYDPITYINQDSLVITKGDWIK